MLFPVKLINQFSKNNEALTHKAFWACVFIATIKAYFVGENIDVVHWTKFFDHWSESSKAILLTTLDFLSSPIGLMGRGLITFLMFLWLVFIFTKLKKTINFRKFILPFLCPAILGIPIHIFGIFLHLGGYKFPLFLVVGIVTYLLVFFCVLLINEFQIKRNRSIASLFGSFFLLFIFGGYFTIAPYLSWI